MKTEKLEEACERIQDYRPPQGKAFVAMIRGYLAAAGGRSKDADAALRQAEAGGGWIEGYLRLVRKWAKLLGRLRSAERAALSPQSGRTAT